jgi:hypothetical protein
VSVSHVAAGSLKYVSLLVACPLLLATPVLSQEFMQNRETATDYKFAPYLVWLEKDDGQSSSVSGGRYG